MAHLRDNQGNIRKDSSGKPLKYTSEGEQKERARREEKQQRQMMNANDRATARKSRSNLVQLKLLDMRPGQAKRERKRLAA